MTTLEDLQRARAELRAASEEDVPPEYVAELRTNGILPDAAMYQLWDHWLCIRDVKLFWNQWMACIITCTHGTFKGVSYAMGNAVGESMAAAMKHFKTAGDHAVCFCDDDANDDLEPGTPCPKCSHPVP